MGANRTLKLTNQGLIQFFEGTAGGTNKITVQGPATLASDYTVTLPTAQGAADTFLKNDGAGTLTWATSTATLQSAYANGTKIDADGTEVEIEVAAAQGNVALLIDQDDNQHGISITKDGTGAGSGVNLVNAGTGTSLNVQNTSTGKGIFLDQDGAATALDIDLDADAVAINVDVFASSTSDAISLLNAGTGKGIFINQDGAAIGLDIDQDGAAIALQVNQATANAAIAVTQQAAAAGVLITGGAGAGLEVNQANDNACVSVLKTNAGTQPCMALENDGAGIGLSVNQDGNGVGVDIDSEATSQPLVNLAPVVGNSRGDIAFSTARTSDASSPTEGDAWYNSTANQAKVYDGTNNVPLGTNYYAVIADPGDAGTITPPSNTNFRCEFTNSTGSQTRVLGTPAFIGQKAVLTGLLTGSGTDTTMTNAEGWKDGGAADDVATFSSGDSMTVEAHDTNSGVDWRVTSSAGVAFG